MKVKEFAQLKGGRRFESLAESFKSLAKKELLEKLEKQKRSAVKRSLISFSHLCLRQKKVEQNLSNTTVKLTSVRTHNRLGMIYKKK